MNIVDEYEKKIKEQKHILNSLTNWDKNPAPLGLRASDINIEKLSNHPIKFVNRKKLNALSGKLCSICWKSDSIHLLSASQSGKLILWNAFTGIKEHLISLNNFGIKKMYFF